MPKETAELSVSSPEPQAETSSFLDKLNPPAGGHKFKILGGALLVLGFAGVIFGVYKLGQRQIRPGPQPTPTPAAVATPTPDPTANWETYTNFLDDYEIKYPSGWFLYSAAEEKSGADITDSDISRFELVPQPDDTKHLRANFIALSNPKGLTIKDWLEENDKNAVESEISISVAGVSGIKRIENNSEFSQLGEIKRAIAIYLPYKNKVYRVLAFPANSKLISTFNLMLSTFRFWEEVTPTSEKFTCPPAGTLDCMPGPDRPELKYCTSEYSAWIQANCPGVEIVW